MGVRRDGGKAGPASADPLGFRRQRMGPPGLRNVQGYRAEDVDNQQVGRLGSLLRRESVSTRTPMRRSFSVSAWGPSMGPPIIRLTAPGCAVSRSRSSRARASIRWRQGMSVSAKTAWIHQSEQVLNDRLDHRRLVREICVDRIRGHTDACCNPPDGRRLMPPSSSRVSAASRISSSVRVRRGPGLDVLAAGVIGSGSLLTSCGGPNLCTSTASVRCTAFSESRTPWQPQIPR